MFFSLKFHILIVIYFYRVVKLTIYTITIIKPYRGLGGLMVYSSDSHGDGIGSILAAAFGYTLVVTDLYGG